jgi:hypothetical protein
MREVILFSVGWRRAMEVNQWIFEGFGEIVPYFMLSYFFTTQFFIRVLLIMLCIAKDELFPSYRSNYGGIQLGNFLSPKTKIKSKFLKATCIGPMVAISPKG